MTNEQRSWFQGEMNKAVHEALSEGFTIDDFSKAIDDEQRARFSKQDDPGIMCTSAQLPDLLEGALSRLRAGNN